MFNKKKSFFSFCSSLFLLTSCTLGLGSVVDVNPPNIEITYPGQNAVVRDTFVLAGTCDDDTGIKELNIEITDSDDSDVKFTEAISFPDSEKWSGKKNWQIELNPKKETGGSYTYPDGKYIIKVVATDRAGQKSAQATLNIDIDNTAPVYIVQNPGSTVSSTNAVEAFGSVLALNGQTSDDHSVGVSLKFYSEDGSYIPDGDVSVFPITTSGNTELARFSANGSSQLSQVYRALYGNQIEDGKKKYSCTLTVFDQAKVYKNPGDGGSGNGNETTKVFLYDSVFSQYLSKTGLGLTLADFKKVLNGTEVNPDVSRETLESLLVDTSDFERDGVDNRLAFSLKPISPALYSVENLSFEYDEGSEYATYSMPQSYNGSNIYVIVNAGADGTGVKKSNLRMWLKEFTTSVTETEISSYEKSLRGITKVQNQKIFEALSEGRKEDADFYRQEEEQKVLAFDKKTSLLFDGSTEPSNSSSSISLSVKLPEKGIIGGKFYGLYITGFDEEGSEIEPESGYYGFLGLATGDAPLIRINSPENLVFVQTSAAQNGLKFTGKASPAQNPLTRLNAKITVKDENSNTVVGVLNGSSEKEIRVEKDLTDELTSWDWECTLEDFDGYENVRAESGDNHQYLYTAEFTIYEGNKNSIASRTVHVDSVKPAIEITSVNYIHSEKTFYKADGITPDYTYLYVNGNLTVQGSVIEQNLVQTGWKAVADNVVRQKKDDLGAVHIFNQTIDTTKIADGNDLREFDVLFFAEDSVGNRGEVKLSKALSSQYPENTFGQIKFCYSKETDLPVIEVLNADLNGKTADFVNNGGNIFEKNSKLIIRVSDDDAVSEVTVLALDKDGNEIDGIEPSVFNEIRTGSITYSMPGKEGICKIVIKAKDIYGTESSDYFFAGIASGSGSVVFALTLNDSEHTTISSGDFVMAKENTLWTNERKILVKGNITSDIPIVKVLYGTEEIASGEDLKEFTHEIIPTGHNDDAVTVSYTLVNSFSQSSICSFVYVVDESKPVFISSGDHSLLVGDKVPGAEWIGTSEVTASGYFKDPLSGVKEVRYEVWNGTGNNKILSSSGVIPAVNETGTRLFRFRGTVSGFTKGKENQLVLTAVDYVGNCSEPQTVSVWCDLAKPEVNLANNIFITNNQELSITGTAEDDASGINRVEVAFGNKTYVLGTDSCVRWTPVSGGKSGTWEFVANCSDFGTETIRKAVIKVYDCLDRYSEAEFSVIKDSDKPNVFIDRISPVSSGNRINNVITISGRVTDNSSLDPTFEIDSSERALLKLSYRLNQGDGFILIPVDENKNFYSRNECYSWNYTFDVSKIITEKHEVQIKAECIDAFGNVGEAKETYLIDPESDYPVISLSNVGKDNAGFKLAYKLISGTVNDDDGEIQKLWFTYDPSNLGEGKIPSLTESNEWDVKNWKTVPVDNGSWSISDAFSSLEDGNYSLYFCCVDSTGKLFLSNRDEIIFHYKNDFDAAENVIDRKGSVEITFDTTEPVIDSISFMRSSSNDNISRFNPGAWTPVMVAGGNEKYIYAKLVVVGNAVSGIACQAGSGNEEDLELNKKYKLVQTQYFKKNDQGRDTEITQTEYAALSGYAKNAVKIYRTYYCGPFDTSSSSFSESTTIRFIVSNGTYRGQKTTTFLADYEGPKIVNIFPAGEVKGKTEITFTSDDLNGTSEIKWVIPRKPEEGNPALTIDSANVNWSNTLNLEGELKIRFQSDEESSLENLSTFACTDYAELKNGLWEIPLWFKTKDNLGNTGYTEHKILFNKDSGIPSCTILYPEKEKSAVSGIIDIRGKADCTNTVKEVQVQLDVNGDGNFDSSDYSLIYNYWKDSNGQNYFGSNLVSSGDDWYIKVSGTEDWILTVDTGLIKKQGTDPLPVKIGIRGRAYNNANATKGFSEVREVQLNWDKPSFKNLKMVQKNSLGEKSIVLLYEKGMFIGNAPSGSKWYLEGTVEDTNSNTVLKSVSVANTSVTGGSFSSSITRTENTQHLWNFSIPLDLASQDGIVEAEISGANSSADNSGISKENILLYVDTIAPAMETRNGSLVLKSLGQSLNADSHTIQNSDSVFNFGGEGIIENGSGLKGLAFFFVRGSGANARIYDPLQNYDPENNNTRSKISLAQKSQTTGSVYINDDGLPVMYLENSGAADALSSVKCPSVKGNFSEYNSEGNCTSVNLFRKGALIKAGGVYRKVTGFDSVNGTISFEPKTEESFTSAEFVLAQIVDNTIKESFAYSDFTSILNDDGDGMEEYLSETQGRYKWTASVFSDYIPDGPVEIHVVAIDKVGNINHGFVQTKIRNRAPRLSKVLLGTDLNGNGKFDFWSGVSQNAGHEEKDELGEFVYYSCLDRSGESREQVLLGDTEFTIKNKFALIPEFVGGNGNIKYTFQISDNEDPEILRAETSKLRNMVKGPDSATWLSTKEGSLYNVENAVSSKGFVVIENNTQDFTSGTAKTFDSMSNRNEQRKIAFTFWDETEESEQGLTSQCAFVSFNATINTNDKTKPVNNIAPFFWNGLNDNSIYGSVSARMTTQLKGHIELEEDLTDEIKNTEVNGTKLGSDPKVSGKIVIKGTTSDDVSISSLWFRFGNVNLGGRSISSNGKTYYLAAEYKNVNETKTWVPSSATMDSNKWEFKVSNNIVNQAGHSIEWTMSVDTALVDGESGLDIVAGILAVDSGIGTDEHEGNYSDPAEYQMDVVPYIVDISTGLSEKEKTNPTVYNRTALGHYPVRGNKNENGKSFDATDKESGEQITINGFNFGSLTKIMAQGYPDEGLSPSMEQSGKLTFCVGNMNSGLLSVKTAGGIVTLNNLNDNEKEINTLSNRQNNNNLNDDVFLDVWEFKNIAVQDSSELKDPTVRFNPVNNMIGASYANNEFFNMPGRRSANNLYSQYPYMKGQGGYSDSTFVYDKNGYTYGAAQSQYNNGDSVGGYFRFVFGNASDTFSPYDAFRGRAGSSDLESNSINIRKFPKANASEWMTNPSRIVSPQIVADALDENSKAVMVHIAYADTATNQIRYRRSIVSPAVVGSKTSNTNPNLVTFNPNAQELYVTGTGAYYKIVYLPEGYDYAALTKATNEEGKYKVGDEIKVASASTVIYAFKNEGDDKFKLVLDENYIRAEYVDFLKGSSLRSVNDFDEEYMILPFDLSEAEAKNSSNGNTTIYTTRFPDYYYAVDLYQGTISTAMTGYTNSTGNKPGYPYYKFVNGSNNSSSSYTYPFYAPDSLQNLAGQTVHVVASSGKNLAGTETMELYTKSSSGSADGKIKPNTYKYNAGKSVALGVGQNHYPVIAWHDSEQNKLYLSYNTSTNISGKIVDSVSESERGELEQAEYNTHTNKGTPYGVHSATDQHAFYAIYPSLTSYGGSIYLDYYILTDSSLDISDSWDGTTHYNSSGVKTGENYVNPSGLKTISSYKAGAYKIKTLDAYTTPDNFKYRVMKMKKTTVKTGAVSTYLIYNNGNSFGTGQILEEKTVQGKKILVPVNKTVGQTNDANTQTEIEYFQPENFEDYMVQDGTYVYASFPLYEFFLDSDEYMGTAVENINNSFDRTRKWENHTVEVLGAGEYGGQDVQMVVCDNGDNTDTVHLAFYDEMTGSLKYTSFKFSDGGFSGQTPIVTIDDYGDVGEKLTLEVVRNEEGGVQIPYIGYYGNKRAKMAYLVDLDSGDTKEGVLNNVYTGKWEVTFVPTEKSVGKDRINVALNKDVTTGVVKAGSGAADTVNPNNSKVYSNGTKNPVMGYINANGNLEIGQKR